jgi:hypothetical protein
MPTATIAPASHPVNAKTNGLGIDILFVPAL